MKFYIWVLWMALAAQGAWGQRALHLKSCGAAPCAGRKTETVTRMVPRRHYLVEFAEYPGAGVRAELERRGIRVMGFVPDRTMLVAASGHADLAGMGVTWAGRLESEDKISREVAQGAAGTLLVVFHADTDMDEARRLADGYGFTVLENPDLLPGQLLLAGGPAHVEELARAEQVAYILPASADLVAGYPVVGCAGAVTASGPVAEYATAGSGWTKDAAGVAGLLYVFQSVTEKLAESVVRGEIERAFREWEKYAAVRLTAGTAASAARTITILFARRAHGDGYAFDGAGAVLAHTFYPAPLNGEPIAGDMHLDADENWHAGANTDVFSVALHEAGHALGLAHSSRPGSVMYPYYRLSTGLTDDDIAGIRSLYGEALGAAPTPAPAPAPPPAPAPAPAPAKDTVAPGMAITSPGQTIVSTALATLRVAGTASDNVGVAAVKWTTSNGGNGTAYGTTAWWADVPLLVGTTTVTVRAYDAAGNSAWRAITVVRR